MSEDTDRPNDSDEDAPVFPATVPEWPAAPLEGNLSPGTASQETAWLTPGPTASVEPPPTLVSGPDAETTRLGAQPTYPDPTLPAVPPTTPSWSSPPTAPSWSSPTSSGLGGMPPAPPAFPPPSYGQPPPGQYAAPQWGQPAYGQAQYGGPAYGQHYGPPGTALPGVAGWGAVPQAPKPGVVPLRPLGLGEILDGAISYIRRDPTTVLGISAVISLGVAALQLVLLVSFSSLLDALARDTTNPSDVVGLMPGAGGLTIVVVVLSFVLNILATGMLTTVMGQAVLGRRVTAAEAWQRAAARFWPLLGLTLLIGLILTGIAVVGLGISLLLGVVVAQASNAGGLGILVGLLLALATWVAWVWVYIRLLLAPVALMLEGAGILRSLRRSMSLVTGAWWRVFGIHLLGAFLGYVVTQVLSIPFALIGGAASLVTLSGSSGAMPIGQSIASALGTLVSSTVVIPFTAGIVTLLYIDRRIRREALDLELARAAGVGI